MWMAISILLAAVCVLLAVRLLSQTGNIEEAVRQLRRNREAGSGARLGLKTPDRATEQLLVEVEKLKEDCRRQEERLREKERDLRREIANVSHDLRTPLTSISGYLQLMEEGNLTEEERAEYLHTALGRVGTLGTLVTTFYDLSRIESGDYPMDRKELSLEPLLRRVLAENWVELEDSGISVTAELQETKPVFADENAALRIFENLLGNAKKHAAESLTVRLYEKQGHVVTEFGNPAPGMTEEDAKHVFERSYTGDKMRSGRNTGLGLAIVKALSGQMGNEAYARWQNGVFTVGVLWHTGKI